MDTILTDWSPPEVRVLSCAFTLLYGLGTLRYWSSIFQLASLAKTGMGTPSIMTTLATWTQKVGEYHISTYRLPLKWLPLCLIGLHRSCRQEDIVKLKVMHAEMFAAKTREFTEKVGTRINLMP